MRSEAAKSALATSPAGARGRHEPRRDLMLVARLSRLDKRGGRFPTAPQPRRFAQPGGAAVNCRTFLGTLTGGLLAAPLASQAQQAGKVYRIGLLGLASASDRSGVAALREGLQDLGYEEGKNLVIEYCWAEGQYDRLPGFAAELVRLKVDAIVTYGTPGALAAKQATKTIPVVVAIMGDAVATGVVATLVRPGGNITGSQFHFPQIMAKRIELLKKALPRLTRAAVLTNVANHSFPPALKAMEDAARSLGLELQQAEVRSPDDFGSAFAAMAKRRAEAFIVADDPMLRSHGQTIAKLAAQRQLPSVGEREYVERRAAGLRGEASRGVAPSGGLHRQNPEMRQAGRSAVRADRPGRDDG